MISCKFCTEYKKKHFDIKVVEIVMCRFTAIIQFTPRQILTAHIFEDLFSHIFVHSVYFIIINLRTMFRIVDFKKWLL